MRYIKVRVSYQYAPDRLYRVLLVPENVNLLRLAQIICDSLHVEWEHQFEFRKGYTHYAMYPEDAMVSSFTNETTELMQDYDISALGQKAVFEYDFGDGWLFNVRIYKRVVERADEKDALILEGAGQGIWEDNRWSLDSYFAGKIDDDYVIEDGGEYALPWNFDNTLFSDFDKPLDLSVEQDFLEERLERTIILDNEENSTGKADAVLDVLLSESEGLDCLGADKALHKWATQTIAKLRSQYGEPRTSILVARMLLEEQRRLIETYGDEEID